MKENCPDCGCEYTSKGLGHHWRQSSCNYPTLTKQQHDIVTGILMSDGCIEKRESGSILSIGMVNKKFLEWLDNCFGILSTGVTLKMKSKESAKKARESGFRPEAKEENYSNVYSLRTRTLPDLDKYREWYSSGEKVFPDISYNPTIVKMWYCGDGGLIISDRGKAQAQIRFRNESDRSGKILESFKDLGYDPNLTNSGSRIYFSTSDTEDLLNWMGRAPPGFEYKWENKNFERYKRLKTIR